MNLPGERLDATIAGEEKQAFAPGGRSDVDGAAVGRAGVFCDEAPGFKGVDDAGHGGWANLLRVSEPAEGDGPCENDDGERRETGGIEAGGRIDAAQVAQQMDGGRVEGLGGGIRIALTKG